MQYVKICDAYGAGFFYIPGTDTCLRVGGLVMADLSVSNAPNKFVAAGAANIATGATFGATWAPSPSRDAVSWGALGRVELDARTQSPWGTVRSFIRIDSYFGSGAVANTGALSNGIISPGFNGANVALAALGTQAARESTVLSKGFIQFAGFTMGRIQSMFDFYADAATYSGLRGSNQTVNGLAYTATFGGGFSATLSIEDEVSHRARGTIANVIGGAGVGPLVPGTVAPTATSLAGAGINTQFLGTRMPDIVANLRVDQPWGSAQLSAAVHRVGVGMYNVAAIGAVPGNALLNKSDSLGFAVQGGVKFNLPMLAPGDNLWLQATYAKGAVGYTNGSNFAFVNGVYSSTNYGVGIARVSSGNGWNQVTDGDCVFTYAGSCDKSTAFAVVGAFTHYWTPSVKSWLAATYYQVKYSDNAINPVASALAAGATTFAGGLTNYKEFDLVAGLAWNPIRGFEIGAEATWMHGIVSRPVGLSSDAVLLAAGLPAFKSQSDLFRGRLRMIRAF